MTHLTLTRCLILTGVGLALATAGPAAAQGTSLADRSISAKQSGRTIASTRTDAQGEFRFDLPIGVYDLCVAAPSQSQRQGLPDHGSRLPGNGGRAGGQAMGGAAAEACFSHTADLPDNNSRRSEPIPVAIRQPDGTIIYAVLAGMRTVDAPGGGSGPVRNLPNLSARARANTGGGSDAGPQPAAWPRWLWTRSRPRVPDEIPMVQPGRVPVIGTLRAGQ